MVLEKKNAETVVLVLQLLYTYHLIAFDFVNVQSVNSLKSANIWKISKLLEI